MNTGKDRFFFQLHTSVYSGIGHSREIPSVLNQKKVTRLLLLVDQGCAEHSSYFSEFRGMLENSVDRLDTIELRSSEEPDYDYLDQVAAKARGLSDIDAIVGIGGGSAMDITKAVSVLLMNPGKGIEYRGFDNVKKPGIPCMCIPTTAGTGSEVTINAVFTDKQEMKKLGINGRYMNAAYAVLDAEWTLSCPPSAALSAGMDAMTHALESFSCKQQNTLTRAFSREGFKLLYENLPCLVQDPANKLKRQNLLVGSYLAAAGLFNSGSGIAGAFSYPLGVHFKVPHGIGGAIFLASVVEFNANHGYTGYAELLDMIEPHPELDASEKSVLFATRMRELAALLSVPQTLEKWGVTSDKADEVGKLLLPLQAAFDQNPVPFSAEKDAPKMLLRHIG